VLNHGMVGREVPQQGLRRGGKKNPRAKGKKNEENTTRGEKGVILQENVFRGKSEEMPRGREDRTPKRRIPEIVEGAEERVSHKERRSCRGGPTSSTERARRYNSAKKPKRGQGRGERRSKRGGVKIKTSYMFLRRH